MAVTLNANTSTGFVATSDLSGAMALQTSGATAVTIDSSQNVGVGITSPTAKLHVYGGSNNQFKVQSSGAEANFTLAGTSYGQINNTTGDLYVTSDAGGIIFRSSSSERMRLSSDGALLWGCTAQSGSIPTSSGIAFGISGTTYDNAMYFRNGADPTYVLDFYNTAGSRAGKVTVNASTTSYDTSSDYRLKENVAPMTGALQTVSLLKPVTYTWKQTGESGQGFIAHELQEVVPDAVTGTKDGVDRDGNPDYQGVDASFLVATLTAAIQELKAIVDAQATEIAELKSKVGP